jgi:hypothetical protein
MIIEDDAVFSKSYFLDDVEAQMLPFTDTLLYLQYNEQKEQLPSCSWDTTIPNHPITIPSYPFNTTAVVINPDVAADLLKRFVSIISIDDFLAIEIYERGLKAKVFALGVVHVGENLGSSFLESNPQYFSKAFNVHVITAGTDRKKCMKLYDSASLCGVNVKNIMEGHEWTGGDMTYPGGGVKINAVKKYLDTLDMSTNPIILFTDAYDVMFLDDMDAILSKFFAFKCNLLFAAEKNIWPNPALAPLFTEAFYPYLNSGCYIGYGETLKKFFNKNILDTQDDQEYCQERYLLEQLGSDYTVLLDSNASLFQCFQSDDLVKRDNYWKNLKTGNSYSIYHSNGSMINKSNFNDFFDTAYGNTSSFLIPKYWKTDKLSDDIVAINFMTPSMCEKVIEILESKTFEALKDDEFPGEECRMSELGLEKELNALWLTYVEPFLWNYWKTSTKGLRDSFVIRYRTTGQRKLAVHHDSSVVSGGVKLNDNYVGGELYFPRYNITNVDVPIGKVLLFPGQVTHSHESKELLDGTKYSLVMWTGGAPLI